jgi:hypothetical protein
MAGAPGEVAPGTHLRPSTSPKTRTRTRSPAVLAALAGLPGAGRRGGGRVGGVAGLACAGRLVMAAVRSVGVGAASCQVSIRDGGG